MNGIVYLDDLAGSDDGHVPLQTGLQHLSTHDRDHVSRITADKNRFLEPIRKPAEEGLFRSAPPMSKLKINSPYRWRILILLYGYQAFIQTTDTHQTKSKE
jgi:hypothetical protein